MGSSGSLQPVDLGWAPSPLSLSLLTYKVHSLGVFHSFSKCLPGPPGCQAVAAGTEDIAGNKADRKPCPVKLPLNRWCGGGGGYRERLRVHTGLAGKGGRGCLRSSGKALPRKVHLKVE